VLQLEVLVLKFITINRHSTRSIEIRKVSPLNHKVRNDAMKNTSFVRQFHTSGVSFRAFAEGFKILDRPRYDAPKKSHYDTPSGMIVNFNIKIDPGRDFRLRFDYPKKED
jgi:hypothetical protein